MTRITGIPILIDLLPDRPACYPTYLTQYPIQQPPAFMNNFPLGLLPTGEEKATKRTRSRCVRYHIQKRQLKPLA